MGTGVLDQKKLGNGGQQPWPLILALLLFGLLGNFKLVLSVSGPSQFYLNDERGCLLFHIVRLCMRLKILLNKLDKELQ